MKIKKGFILRKVGGESVVVPVGDACKTFHGMIKLNETGEFLWKFFSEDHTEDEGVARLLEEYDVEEPRAREDVQKFLHALKENGFLA